MLAVLILDLQALAARQKLVAMQREIGRRVIENVVPALLRFEQNRESAVAANVDPVDRVHLAGNAKGHGAFNSNSADLRQNERRTLTRRTCGPEPLAALCH